jgi:hypothetical protein
MSFYVTVPTSVIRVIAFSVVAGTIGVVVTSSEIVFVLAVTDSGSEPINLSFKLINVRIRFVFALNVRNVG